MKNNKIVYLIVCLSTFKITQSGEVLTPLKEQVTTLKSLQDQREELKAQYETKGIDQENVDDEEVSYIDLLSVEAFVNELIHGKKCMGRGWLGNVFPFTFREEQKEIVVEMAVQLVKLKGDPQNKSHLKKQMRFARKLDTRKKILKMPKSDFFFMDFYGAYEITEASVLHLKKHMPGITKHSIFKKVNTQDDEILLAIFNEEPDVSFQDVINMMKKDLVKIDNNQKMFMAHNLIHGLNMMDDICLNANITPDKIMMVKYEYSDQIKEREEIANSEIFAIQINPGHFYLAKYADTGEAVQGTPETRKASGKVNAYSAPELRSKDQAHHKADVYSVGKMLMEMELASEFKTSLTEIEKVLEQIAMRNEDGINQAERTVLENTWLIHNMKQMFINYKQYNKDLLEEMLKVNPEIRSIVDQVKPVVHFMHRDPETIMYKDYRILKNMIYAYLTVYYNKFIIDFSKSGEMNHIESLLTQNWNDNVKTHFENLKKSIPYIYKLKTELFNLYKSMMDEDVDKRITISEAHSAISKIKEDYKENLKQITEDIYEFLEVNMPDQYAKNYYGDLKYLKEHVVYSITRRRRLI